MQPATSQLGKQSFHLSSLLALILPTLSASTSCPQLRLHLPGSFYLSTEHQISQHHLSLFDQLLLFSNGLLSYCPQTTSDYSLLVEARSMSTPTKVVLGTVALSLALALFLVANLVTIG